MGRSAGTGSRDAGEGLGRGGADVAVNSASSVDASWINALMPRRSSSRPFFMRLDHLLGQFHVLLGAPGCRLVDEQRHPYHRRFHQLDVEVNRRVKHLVSKEVLDPLNNILA